MRLDQLAGQRQAEPMAPFVALAVAADPDSRRARARARAGLMPAPIVGNDDRRSGAAWRARQIEQDPSALRGVRRSHCRQDGRSRGQGGACRPRWFHALGPAAGRASARPRRSASSRSSTTAVTKGISSIFVPVERQQARFALRQVEHGFRSARQACRPRRGSPRHIPCPDPADRLPAPPSSNSAKPPMDISGVRNS